jgi:lysyl-tRNA synthetase class 2
MNNCNFVDIVSTLTKEPILIYNSSGESTVLDVSSPFKKVHVVEELERYFGCSLPNFNGNVSYVIKVLSEMCHSKGVSLDKGPQTISKILDRMISCIIEPNCIQPTFVLGHPAIMSPLAKSKDNDPLITERFELFIGGKEYVNAYVELNDPYEQRNRFLLQQADRKAGDMEAQILDEGFCVALEYGMPPTVGWGLGVDRLCMLVSNSKHIRDVIAFPISKINHLN